LNNYIYGFEPGKHVNNFKMKINVIGASSEVDYPVSTMTPNRIQKTPDGITLFWERNSSQSQLNIGVTLPDRINIARQCEVMVKRAPVFYLLFFFSLFALLRLSGYTLNFIQIMIVSAAYFLFYPLIAYLSMYMPVSISFGLSFGVIGLLIWNYSRIVHTRRIANAIAVAYTFYLGITSLAALLPTYTGLILVLEGVVLIGVIMQVMSRFKDIKLSDL
jgi:inner membrane protein involved in colicin E2 resistance